MVDVDETWRVYSTALGNKLPESRILNFGPCAVQGCGRDDPPQLGDYSDMHCANIVTAPLFCAVDHTRCLINDLALTADCVIVDVKSFILYALVNV